MPEDTKKEPEESMVQIPKSKLDLLVSTLEKRGKDVELLYKLVDQNKLSRARELQGDTLVKTCKVWQWNNGKFVIATKLVKNVAEVVNGRYIEDQEIEMVFDDGTSQKTSYLDFSRNKKMVVFEIVARKDYVRPDGVKSVMLSVVHENGKKLEVSIEFIN